MGNPAETWGTTPGEVLGNTIATMEHETGQIADDVPAYLGPDGYDESALAVERNIALKAIAFGVQALVLQGERDWKALDQ